MEINNKRVAILMATYNGGAYIKQQIESILNQSFKNWTLFIRDDGSTDDTIEIVRQYEQNYTQIHVLQDNDLKLGPRESFLRLLNKVDSDYYMFCDQDDVWFNTKVEITLNKMVEIEETHKESPIIVHTDVTLVDVNMNILANSYWEDIHLDPNRIKNIHLLPLCGFVQGATMLFNKKAKVVAFPLNDYKPMHDTWVATRVMKADGIIYSMYLPTMYYRQHGSNVFGVRYGKTNGVASRLRDFKNVIEKNKKCYINLKKDNYGGIVKYIYYKIYLEIHLHLLYKFYKKR